MNDFPEADYQSNFSQAGTGDLLDPPTGSSTTGQGQPATPGATSPGAPSPEGKHEAGTDPSPKGPQVDVYRDMQAKLDRERAARERAEHEKQEMAKKLESVDNLSEIEKKSEALKRQEAELAAREERNRLIATEFPHLKGNEDLVPLSDTAAMRQTAERLTGLSGGTDVPAPSFGASAAGNEPVSKQFENVGTYEEARVKLNELDDESFNRLSREMGYGGDRDSRVSDYEASTRNRKK